MRFWRYGMGDTGNCGTELNFYFILFHAARNFYLSLPSFPFFYFGVEVFLKLAFMKVLMCVFVHLKNVNCLIMEVLLIQFNKDRIILIYRNLFFIHLYDIHTEIFLLFIQSNIKVLNFYQILILFLYFSIFRDKSDCINFFQKCIYIYLKNIFVFHKLNVSEMDTEI